jgi:hypothetical protein
MVNRPFRANDVQVDTVRRARCRITSCRWTGPDRPGYQEANGDRQGHLDWHQNGEPDGDAQHSQPTVPAGQLRDHIDADHVVMVRLGRVAAALSRTAESAVQILEQIRMDTAEDQELHARAIAALRGSLDKAKAGLAGACTDGSMPPGSVPHADVADAAVGVQAEGRGSGSGSG